MHKKLLVYIFLSFLSVPALFSQINTERVLNIGRNALYFEDYILSIQYFNQVIKVKPYLAEPYFYRGIAKLNLEDYRGAEEDCTLSIERNPFIVISYQVRGIARQNQGNFKGAIEDYTTGLNFAPEDRTFWGNKAIAETQLKQYDDAEKSFDNLIRLHPSFYDGYLGRGQFYLEKGDTTLALRDIDKAILLDKHQSYAYAQRAIVKFQFTKKYDDALSDMNEAIRLDPNTAGYYINRGLIKYHMNDLRGTMSDYDRVLTIDPNNVMAYYNRGLLRMQVGEKNKAISDFSKVIEAEPENFFAYYNRAILYDEIGNYKAAIRDYTQVLNEYPNFAAGYYARSEAKRKSNDRSGGEKDFMYAMNLQKKAMADQFAGKNENLSDEDAAKALTASEDDQSPEKTRKESDKNIRKFSRILVADNTGLKHKYTNEFRGRVQDRNITVDLEPSFVLTYYEKSDQLRHHIYYDKELEEFNNDRYLSKRLLITNAEAALDSLLIGRHFTSIDDYSRLIEINPNNPLPYFGRSLDFMLIQDFNSAINDLNRLIMMSGNFAFAYFNRAVVRYKRIEYRMSTDETDVSDIMTPTTRNFAGLGVARDVTSSGVSAKTLKSNDALSMEYEMVLRDYDKVIELNPNFVYAYYNRANVRSGQKDFKSALVDYNTAIRLRPDFAQAYFNRGLIYVYQGETKRGIADLSKAGELGIVSAYSVIKRLKD